jgi:sugar phosphate isomerase/epimerase
MTENKVHFHEIPGEGDIDFAQVAALVKAAKYPHYISVELHNHDQDWQRALDVSRDYLVKCLLR